MTEYRIKAIIAIILSVLFSIANAEQWRVPYPYPTIQMAIDVANNGDTVSVWGPPFQSQPFTYRETLDFLGKAIHVTNRSFIQEISGYPQNDSWVIIDAESRGTAVKIHNVTGRAVLQGFTIQNGRAA